MTKGVYFDNAATTALDPQVLEAMLPYFKDHFGNPSSIHTHGREARAAIEKARKKVAQLINAAPSEVFFTSGGTEADNTALTSSIRKNGIQHAISSKIEHHAVLHCLQALEKRGEIQLHFVDLNADGSADLSHLEKLLQTHSNALVSLMHANNELGTLNDLSAISALCKDANAIFHADTVQTMGHLNHNVQEVKRDFMVGSAHKFHGPKGVGFLYAANPSMISPLIHGGSQERNMRGGTENVYAIIGLAKALELAYEDLEGHSRHIQELKTRMIDGLKKTIPDVQFNGNIEQEKSLYTILNVSLPASENNDMLLFNLDIKKISASGGSACTSGSDVGSHVLQALHASETRGHVRFSFSRMNTKDEIDYALQILSDLFPPKI